MTKLLAHTALSLDGFISGPNHAMDWVFRNAGQPIPEAEAVRLATGSILCGRGCYDAGHRPEAPPQARKAFGGNWSGTAFVLTHRIPPGDDDPDTVFLTAPIEEAVARAREAAGTQDVLVLGANVVRQCIEAGLLDEILVHVVPVLLGDGTRLFERPGGVAIDLEPMSSTRSGRVTNLRFRVPR